MMNFTGLIIGIATFLAIGIFHPIVIKAEYHFGVRCWWWFLVAGILFVVASVFVDSVTASTILGVLGFSCFWSIHEVVAQQERVRKGWFPRNPKRTYPWDVDAEGYAEKLRKIHRLHHRIDEVEPIGNKTENDHHNDDIESLDGKTEKKPMNIEAEIAD